MISVGSKVSVIYEGRFEDGTVFDSSQVHGGSPLEFVVGAGTVLPGLERAVVSMDLHQRQTVAIGPQDAYGVYEEALVQRVPAAGFPDIEKLPVGSYIMLDIDGERKRAKVADVNEDAVLLDFNHEFAGKTLVFDLEVVAMSSRTGSLVEDEQHAADCPCGCHRLQEQLVG